MKTWIARRPKDSSLNSTKAVKLLKTRFYDTQEALKMFRKEWYEVTKE